MNFKKLCLMLSFLVVLGTTTFAQTTWYVNNQIGNDGRNGLSATIPSPDDGVTGPKKTIGGAQGAVAESNSGDVIVVANTGVQYTTLTGDAPFAVTKKLTFRSTGGTVDIGVLVTINNALASPNNVVIFDSGEFKLSAGLTLTLGVVTNSSQLITVTGTITRSAAAAVVNGQLKFTAPVNFSYGATMTTADEFVVSGGTLNNITTTTGNLTIKSGTSFTMTGIFVSTSGTLNLGGGVVTITNTGNTTHTFGGGNVSNGTLAFNMGGAIGGTVTINGAVQIPNVSATTSNTNAQTLAIAQPTAVTGTLTVSGNASVTTSAALITVGTTGFTGNEVTLSGVGTITFSGTPTTIHGSVLLNTALTTTNLTGGATITFGAAATINGSVTNNSTLTVTNAATWDNMTSGRIAFGDFAYTITGNVVNSTSIDGVYGAALDVNGFGHITFANSNTNVTINGAINNNARTTLAGSTGPIDLTDNGMITWGNNITSGIIRADGGINNGADFSGITNASNGNNGRIVIGGVARTGVSTIGTSGNPVGAITNSSKGRTAGDGNGDIIFGVGDASTSGTFGTSVTISGSAVGGYTIIGGNENISFTGAITNNRTHASTALVFGPATGATGASTLTIGGNVVNGGTNTTSFSLCTTGAVTISGSMNSSANGTITFPNIAAAAVTIGGFNWSSGTFNIATHNQTLNFNGVVSVSGGTVNWSSSAGQTIVVTGNASFTGGAITSTNRTSITLNSPNITIGGTTTNTTFNTAGTSIIIGNPSPTSLCTVTIGTFNPQIAGAFTVSTNNGLAQPVNFTGGTMTVNGVLTFNTVGTTSLVNISNQANITVVGNFVNTTGYTTTEQGRVTLEGTGAQTFGGAGKFGNIEFKNTAANPTASSNVTLTGFVYLTAGTVAAGANTIFLDNSTVYPTIVRNAGSFGAPPTFTSMVNVTYIGDDKAVGNELPGVANKLNNLTVATTTGISGARNTPSRGAVLITTTTVNGTLSINSGQALIINNGQTLSIKGASVVANGDIANIGTGVLSLERTDGTTISGGGYLPPITVAAGSSNNIIDGPIALIDQLYGTDGEIDPTGALVNDFNPATTAASGNLAFGNGTATLSLKLSGVAFNGTGLNNITTANANNTLTLISNIGQTGIFTHAAGTIALGDYTLTVRGNNPTITGGALITSTSTGKLVFNHGTLGTGNVTGSTAGANSTITSTAVVVVGDYVLITGTGDAALDNNYFTVTAVGVGTFIINNTVAATGGAIAGTVTVQSSLFVNTANATIGANVEVSNDDYFVLNNAGFDLTLEGTLTLTDKTTGAPGANFFLGAGRVLTATGSSVTVGANCAFGGTGTLRLNATTPPLTFTYSGAATINNLRVSNDVTLAGTGTTLTVATLFTHDGGVLNFGSKDLTFRTTFTRTAGSYDASTGYMIFDGTATSALTVNQGTGGFTVPNLKITASGANNVTLNTAQGTVTVSKIFEMANGTQTFTTNSKLAVSTGATVNYTSGNISVAPTYAGTITLVGLNYANPTTIPALIWPTTTGLVTTFTVNGGAAGDVLNLPGSRTIVSILNLTRGTLNLGANTLTLGTGATINRTSSANPPTVTTGGFAFPSDNSTNVNYFANAVIGSGIELPATLNNLTISRNVNNLNAATTINSSVTINGTLAINNDFTIAATPPVINVRANGNITIVNQSATYSNATNPVITNNQSLVLGGATGNQTITVPSATPPLNIGNITINKASGKVILTGGNLAVGTAIAPASITFTKGIVETGSNVLFLYAPTTNQVATGLAISQGYTGASFESHVVGNVGKTLINTGGIGASTEARSAFPVGTGTVYRPAAINFNPAFGVPTTPNMTIVVSHIDANPGGVQALPIKDGVAPGIDVSRYPAFYWYIYTTPGSVGPTTPFDIELTAGNFTDYDSPANVRIIRRHGAVGDINNDWLLQGANNAYDNEVSSVTGFTAINRNANAGLRSGGAVFTLGVKSNMKVKTSIPKQWLVLSAGAKSYSLANLFEGNIGPLTFSAQSSNSSVVTAVVPTNSTTLTLTPVTTGDAFVTVKAADAANNDFFAYTFPVNVGLVGVDGEEIIPTEFSLSQNFPNPFNPTTNIKFGLPKESNVVLRIYNILGEEVATLVNKVMPAGFHTVNFDASRLTSGLYIYRIEAENFVQVKKMMLMK